MSLITAHKILIGTAAVFFVFYAGWEFAGARAAAGGVIRGAVSLLAAVGLLLYFRTIGRPERGSGAGGER
ncbi:MAG TPA: hypothetical protein VFT43_04010 [Candidatus Polarisedimenticolia bacterium]|nr:hypothetical protein [Candidatus Polarisedimenticolia bacterium]